MAIQDYLISARFITTCGHLTALLLLFSTIKNNISVAIQDGASFDQDNALSSSYGALVFGLFCFLFDFSGIFFGNSLFSPTMNMFQILFHFIGSLFLSWLITQNWGYTALWPIIISCNIPTALAEVGMLVSIYVLKTTVY